MPLRICPTCRGMRLMRSGVEPYICPKCGGSGGIPLGDPPTDLSPVVPPSGHSRAAQFIESRMPLLRPLPDRE